ncbi:MAG TPA: redoxin family protein [Rhabdochlamydiaceae bacterium]|nr:redoxin family protein [Rhabdochlamydiaceae bacterium]
MSMAIVSPCSGAGWATYRVQMMHSPIKIGDRIPNVKLSGLAPDGETVENFSTKEELGNGFAAVFTGLKASHSVCSKEHFPGLVKTAEAFENLDIKLFYLTVNTREELFALCQQHDPDHRIMPIPDVGGDFTFLVGLGTDKYATHLGFAAQRSAIFLQNGKVLDIQIEEDSETCTSKSSAQGLLERIPSILNRNDLTCNETLDEIEDSQTNDTSIEPDDVARTLVMLGYANS